jgi:molybdate transport system substrate-binding protein
VKNATSKTLKSFSCLLALVLSAVPAFPGDVHLSVAASLTDVANELAGGYAAKNPDVKFLKNFGGSGALAKQIENGAPSDIFISANLKWMEHLEEKKLVDGGSIRTFAYNALVVAGPANPGVLAMQDLPKLEKIAVGSPGSVPAGAYAMAALKKAGVDRQLEKKLVMAKDVRECLMYAELGEVDAAFVYRTDALLARRAKILFAVPQELYPRVTYPMALTVAGAKNAEAAAFYRYLQSEAAKAVLVKYGFSLK